MNAGPFASEAQRYARLFGDEIATGKFRGKIDGDPGPMRLALEIEKTTPFRALSFRKRLRLLAAAPEPSLTAALRSDTRWGTGDEVYVLTAYALAHAALHAAWRTS